MPNQLNWTLYRVLDSVCELNVVVALKLHTLAHNNVTIEAQAKHRHNHNRDPLPICLGQCPKPLERMKKRAGQSF